MKTVILTCTLLFGLHSQAFLTATDTHLVLKSMRETCRDAWCEGSFVVDFESIRCSGRNDLCLLHLRLTDEMGRALPQSQMCAIEEVGHIDDLLRVDTVPTTLTGSARTAIDKCIQAFKEQLTESN